MGLFDGIGSAVNSVLGGTSSAKKAQKYQLQQMAIQNMYNEKYAKNAHQWEVSDLQKAGLNPVLSAGGSSAGAIAGSSVSTGSGISSTNGNIATVLDAIAKIPEMKLDNANSAKAGADASKTLAETGIIKKYGDKKEQAEIANTLQDTQKKIAETDNIKATKQLTNAQTENEKTKNWTKKALKTGYEKIKNSAKKLKEKLDNDPDKEKYNTSNIDLGV